MKEHFVKTENHKRLLAAASFMEERGSHSACLCLLHGEPSVGKTRNISQWGASVGAVLIMGHVGMKLDGLRWAISQHFGIKHQSNSTAEMQQQIAKLKEQQTPIVFDEAQFGLNMRSMGSDAAGIEYLRQIGEAAKTYVMLICHKSEVQRFNESKHIRTRISHQCEMQNASESDTISFVRELADVEIGDGIGQLVFKQTGGKYRLIENAISALERIAKFKGLKRLEIGDVGNVTLVVDHEQSLIPKAESKTNGTRGGAR